MGTFLAQVKQKTQKNGTMKKGTKDYVMIGIEAFYQSFSIPFHVDYINGPIALTSEISMGQLDFKVEACLKNMEGLTSFRLF